MTAVHTPSWDALLSEVPREPFIPDDIWIYDDCGDLVAVRKATDPIAWAAAVAANAPVITQVNLGEGAPGEPARFPSSSGSQPSLVADMLDALDVRPGHAVLEIGTGTGWNAALLCRRVGEHRRVTTIEVDGRLADSAAKALYGTGYAPNVITGDGLLGDPTGAPFDRIISTAAIREVVPPAWLTQLRRGGRLVTPWGTDWCNGFQLTLVMDADGTATGRFSGDLAFMRIRSQRAALYGWEPDQAEIDAAPTSTTECRGSDLDWMLDPAKGRFGVGARLRSCYLDVQWDKRGDRHHLLDLDDGLTRSFARLDANLNSPTPFTVHQLGPRRLWDEAEAAYDWWWDAGRPGMERFGLQVRDGRQWLWLDEPTNEVRVLTRG